MHGWWAVSYIVLWALVLALSVLVVALARQIGSLHLRLGPRGALELDDEGPPLGTAPEPTAVTTVAGERQVVGGPGAARFLLFVSPSCPACDQVLPSVAAIAGEGSFAPCVIVDQDGSRASAFAGRARLRAPVVASRELAREWEVPGTPYAVVLDERGVVKAKGTVNNLEQVEGLARTAERRIAEGHLAGAAV
jgi:methylamine dehydrogenase accessory protein MauD